MRYSDRAWLTVAGVVVVAEARAPHGELLSEGVDRYLMSRPWITRVVVAYLAAHLLNLIPCQADPLYLLTSRFGRRLRQEVERSGLLPSDTGTG